jgi:hypothetical protein
MRWRGIPFAPGFIFFRRRNRQMRASKQQVLNEQELILRLKQGEEAAFRWVVEAYWNRVYSVVLHRSFLFS